MDKKNTFIGISLLILAFAVMVWQQRAVHQSLANAPADLGEVQKQKIVSQPEIACAENLSLFKQVQQQDSKQSEQNLSFEHQPQFYTLENDYVQVVLASVGGGIHEVVLKKYPATQNSDKPYVFNEGAKLPALSLSMQLPSGDFKEYEPAFSVIYQDATKILFQHVTAEGFEIYRGYSLPQDLERFEPYAISHETRFENKTNQAIDLKELFVNLGAIPPCTSDAAGEFLNVGCYDGEDAQFTSIAYFKGSSGFMGIGKKAPQASFNQSVNPLIWASLKNQFFTSVFTPNKPGTRIFAQTIKMHDEQGHDEYGITARAGFDLGHMEVGDTALLNASYYVGPKEYVRLAGLGEHQDFIMQFGFFGIFSKALLVIMHTIHSIVPNYGLTIILITILVKLLLWPLTAASTRSARKMSQLQGPIQVLKERYKDNPQKIQQETMKLFKEYKVNPAMGCLPILVQIPIFIGLFWMLKSASELRFAHFLWIKDLSMPDTIAFVKGLPLNPLPLLMGVSMFMQMRLAPTATTDAFQKKIFQLMPFIFLVISYNFPSGLVLYWTVQNLLTILQQWISNRKPLPELKIAEITSAGKKSGAKKKNKK